MFVFLRRRVFTQKSKNIQPDSFEDALVTHREMETLERDGRIEMGRRERHMGDEFQDMQFSLRYWRARSRM